VALCAWDRLFAVEGSELGKPHDRSLEAASSMADGGER